MSISAGAISLNTCINMFESLLLTFPNYPQLFGAAPGWEELRQTQTLKKKHFVSVFDLSQGLLNLD